MNQLTITFLYNVIVACILHNFLIEGRCVDIEMLLVTIEQEHVLRDHYLNHYKEIKQIEAK